MNDGQDLTPAPYEPAAPGVPAAPAATTWSAPYRRFLIPAAVLVVVVGVAAGALLLTLKPAGSIEKLVPATVDVYGMANLDPSAAQKLNLLQALHRFPQASTDQKLQDLLDKALKDTGISFTADVRPWLGSQVGAAASLPASGTDTPAAFLAVSRDDAKARAMLDKLRAGSQAKKYTWHDTTYGGVTITVGSPAVAATASATPKLGAGPALASPKAGAYAIVDHVVVIASSEALIHEIIDADQGRTARLVDSTAYKTTLSKLPSERLAMVYVNGRSILSHLKGQLTTPLAAGLAGIKSLGDAEAFQGAGLALSARPEGVVADVAVRFDAPKLSAASRHALAHPGNPKAVIGWIPSSSDAFLAYATLNDTIQSLLDQTAGEPSIKQATDSAGLTGSQGILPHLTGAFALEAELDSSFFPAGALVLGTDDANRMRTFLGGILGLATQGQGTQPTPLASTYRGVTVTTMALPGISLQEHFLPAFAVLDGMGILASTPGELRAIIDAHKDKRAILNDINYAAAARASLPDPSAVFYIDVAKIVKAIQAAPAGSPVNSLHLKTGDDLAPLRGFILTSASQSDAIVERFVVLVK